MGISIGYPTECLFFCWIPIGISLEVDFEVDDTNFSGDQHVNNQYKRLSERNWLRLATPHRFFVNYYCK